MCKVDVKIKDANSHQLFEQTEYINSISANSSIHFETVEWKVKGNLGETFRVYIVIQDATGNLISENYYDLLISDQDEARKQCREKAEQLQSIKSRFPTADYYRFFPELSGQQEVK